jgi:ribose transport system substrate-binding protein
MALQTKTVQSVLRACQILNAFEAEGELLRLRDLVERTGLSKPTVHRLLLTLEQAGMMERVGPNSFRRRFGALKQRPITIGFAGQTSNSTFSRLVSQSIRRAAQTYRVELVEFDNRHSPKVALRNAELFVSRRVNLVLEFQAYENVAPVVASRLQQAGIPVIAIEIPHPGATFFGANNYQAGLMGGRALAKWTRNNWGGAVDQVLLLEERIAGPLPCSRVIGMLAAIRAGLPQIKDCAVIHFDGRGAFNPSFDVVAANNDPSALGALQAFRESSRLEECAIISQNAIPEACDEMRKPKTRMIGSVAYFPERYGDELMPLALSIINGRPAPPSVFVKHTLVTPQNVQRIYPHAEAGFGS